jgi:hypothetical protein
MMMMMMMMMMVMITNLDDANHFNAALGVVRARVDYYPHNMRERDASPFFTNLTEGVEQLQAPSGVYRGVDASEKGAYLQWNLDYPTWLVGGGWWGDGVYRGG